MSAFKVIFTHSKEAAMNYPNPIEAEKLDLVMRDHDHAVFYTDSVMKTPAGNEVADPDIRLLKHMLAKLTIYREIDLDSVNSFSLFCYQRDYLEQGTDQLYASFDQQMEEDPVVIMVLNRSSNLLEPDRALKYLEEHPAMLNLIFWGMPEIGRRLKNFLDELAEGNTKKAIDEQQMKNLFKEVYEALMLAQKSAINLMSCVHGTGLLLPMMLMMGKMTPSEYATAALAINLRRSIQSLEPEKMELFGKTLEPYRLDQNQPESAYRDLHLQAIKALEHTSFYTGMNRELEPGIRDLIGAGESYNLEFKSTFRWDLRQEKKNPAIEHASLKTISAFLNSSGGHLLIGVEDNGNVLGVELDKFDNDDKFLLHFWNLVKSSMGQETAPYIKTTLEKIDGGTVCHVKCMRSPKPVFLNQKGFDEEFYIRTGPSSTSLEIREALQYISERFPSK